MTRTLLFLLGLLCIGFTGFVAGTFGFGMAPGWVSIVAVLALSFPALIACFKLFGWKRGAVVFGILGVFALAIESIGVATGYPYGAFQYSADLGFKLFGLVPWTVPFAWTPLLFAACAAVLFFWPAKGSTGSIVRRSLAAAVTLLAMDLVLDPGAVVANIWVYGDPGSYYGVPWTNFAGWILSGYIGAFVFYKFLPADRTSLPLGFIISGSLSLAFWTGVTLAEGLWIPAAIGIALSIVFFAMYAQAAYLKKIL